MDILSDMGVSKLSANVFWCIIIISLSHWACLNVFYNCLFHKRQKALHFGFGHCSDLDHGKNSPVWKLP